jgi:hypothetical protein
MKTYLPASVLLSLVFLASVGTVYARWHPPAAIPEQGAVGAVEKTTGKSNQPPAKPPSGGQKDAHLAPPLAKGAGEQVVQTQGPSKEQSIWTQGIPGAVVSVLAAIFSLYYFLKSRSLSR